MKLFLRSVWIFLLTSYSLIHLVSAIVLIAIVCFFLGHPLLTGVMMGSDSSFALTTLTYLDKWFPRIPLWYPYQGAGESVTLGYYTLTYYFPIFLHHMTHLTLVQSLRFVWFLSVPIIAIEIYVFCWTRLKNQMIGLMAGLMYPLSSAAWAWMTYGGFYAMSMSLIFIIPTLLFYDWFLDLHLTSSPSVLKKRVALLGAGIFLALAIAGHLAVGASTLLGMGVFTLFRSQLFPLKISRGKAIIVSVACLIVVVIVGVLVSSFAFLPQRHYNSQITADIVPVYGPDIPQLKLSAFLGIDRYDPMFDSIYQPMFLSILITLFAGIGLVLALIKRQKIAAWGIAVLVLAYLVSITKFINGLGFDFALFMLPTNVRLASFVFIIAPIIAAYGFWSLGEIPFWLIKKVFEKTGFKKELFFKIFIVCGATAFSLIIFAYAAYQLRFYQRWAGGKYNQFAYSGIGPMGVINSFCMISQLNSPPPPGITCQQTAPQFVISDVGRDPLPEFKFDQFIQRHNIDQFTRTDVSMHLGLLTATANLHTDMSMINSYNGIGALIYVWWGHEARVMFLNGNYTPENVNEMAKYFGIQYIFLHAGDDKQIITQRYPELSWPTVDKLAGDVMVVKKYKDATGLTTLFTQPTILVIGSHNKNSYEQVFKLAYLGGLSIDQGLLVQGKENIDDYSLDELSHFQSLILNGYSFHDRTRAYDILKQYVNNGGRLFVDTGWQYVAKDWGIDKSGADTNPVYTTTFPDFFPVRQTTWGGIGANWDKGKLANSFAGGIKISQFAPPIYGNGAWGMSLANNSDLQNNATAVLGAGDNVVIAAENYGAGRIVWSGMNVFAHAGNNASASEKQFVKNIFMYLLPGKNVLQNPITYKRNYPDDMTMTFANANTDQSWLYFREAYTSDWHPILILPDGSKQNVQFYKAGPGLTLFYLPPFPRGTVLSLQYNLGMLIPFSVFLSLATLLVLILLIIDSIFGGKITPSILRKIFTHPHVTRLGGKLKFKRPSMKRLIGEEDE